MATESGLAEWFMKKRFAMGINFLGTSKEGSTWTDRFASARLDVPDMPEPRIELKNMRKVFYLYFSLNFISILYLVFETLMWKYIIKDYEEYRKRTKPKIFKIKRKKKQKKILKRHKTI